MDSGQIAAVVAELVALVDEHYIDPVAAAAITDVVVARARSGHYDALDDVGLADAVTADLQSVNGDQHLRLLHHEEPLAQREPGDDGEEYAAMAAWAADTCGGVARVTRLDANIGLVEIAPVLFPVTIGGEAITAAMTLIASTRALILDLRGCRGGDPDLVAWLCSYLHDHQSVELTALDERNRTGLKQSWTLPYVPGQRFGPTKPVFVLTSATTFSGGEQLSYDLQALGRATIVGERTRGGAHAREGFRLTAHLEATISVARAVNPITGTNWEGIGVTPDVDVPASEAQVRAHELAVAALAL